MIGPSVLILILASQLSMSAATEPEEPPVPDPDPDPRADLRPEVREQHETLDAYYEAQDPEPQPEPAVIERWEPRCPQCNSVGWEKYCRGRGHTRRRAMVRAVGPASAPLGCAPHDELALLLTCGTPAEQRGSREQLAALLEQAGRPGVGILTVSKLFLLGEMLTWDELAVLPDLPPLWRASAPQGCLGWLRIAGMDTGCWVQVLEET